MSDWDYLGEAEQNTIDEYCGHVAISDWNAYTDAQSDRRKAAWHWLNDRLACYNRNGSDCQSWEHWQQRRDYIDSVVNGNNREIHRAGPNYPADTNTDNERVYIEEREYYLAWNSAYDAQKERKLANLHALENQRKTIWRRAEGTEPSEDGPGWDVNNRRKRYDNLCIATHYGTPWEQWQADQSQPQGNWRDASADWHNAHLGITESPADSNCDSRSDGIRNSQDKTAGGTWLRYQPWCGCWAFMGLYAAGKLKADGSASWMAGVASIEDKAKAGQAPFSGWTTDGSKARKGDLVVLFGRGQHVGTVRSIDADYAYTWEGNTSSGSGGSQSNGGGSYKRSRSRHSETYGYALVRD